MIILKWILKEQRLRMWTRFLWLRRGSRDCGIQKHMPTSRLFKIKPPTKLPDINLLHVTA
jgi:hypothetical protein